MNHARYKHTHGLRPNPPRTHTKPMSFFDSVRVELAMRSLLTDDVERILGTLEADYTLTSTTEARRNQIFEQTQAATTAAQLGELLKSTTVPRDKATN